MSIKSTQPPRKSSPVRSMNRALEKLDAAVEELKKLDAPPPPWKGLAAWRTRMYIAATKKTVGPRSVRISRRG